MKTRQTNDRSKEQLSPPINPGAHPGSFGLGSLESRAAARALVEARESAPYRCATCFLTGLVVMGSTQPNFVPKQDMEKGPDGWVYKCRKHKDPSKETSVQALIKSGLMKGPTP